MKKNVVRDVVKDPIVTDKLTFTVETLNSLNNIIYSVSKKTRMK